MKEKDTSYALLLRTCDVKRYCFDATSRLSVTPSHDFNEKAYSGSTRKERPD